MKILITGKAGFIARNISEQLGREYVIVSCNSKELNLLDSEKVLDFIKTSKFDIIIHTATYDAAPKHSTKDTAKVLENNLKMFFNITRCKDYFGKMLYFGSGAEFGREHWMPKMKEDCFDRYVPQDQYGFSKYIMTKYAKASPNIYNLRLFGVFGKYEDWRVRFISNACCRVVFDLPIIVKQNVIFDYLYIDDLVKITKWFIDNRPKQESYNVTSGRALDHFSLAKKILKISSKKLEIVVQENKPNIEYSADNSKLMKELGGYNFKDIDEALRELYDWYVANKNTIDRDKLLCQ